MLNYLPLLSQSVPKLCLCQRDVFGGKFFVQEGLRGLGFERGVFEWTLFCVHIVENIKYCLLIKK